MSHQSELIATDIDAYLAQHEQKELLRFLTCGSVDDGKSTLIGRLFYDAKLIFEDTLKSLEADSVTHGTTGGALDPALFTDGLKAEREQGITIDVAYRYFSTARRKFIIADTPGHEQYTRNMATGASNCDLAIILIDARRGVVTQTKRHSFIVSLLGIKHVLVAINKMDLVDHSQDVFEEIRNSYKSFSARLDVPDLHFIPISALFGDNIVEPSENMPWYSGTTLMSFLDSVYIGSDRNLEDFRFPVQYVNRPDAEFRGFCGTLASGIVRRGDEIMALPSRKTSCVESIVTFDGEVEEAFCPQAVTLRFSDEIDVSRGDIIVRPGNVPRMEQSFDAMVIWMHDDPLVPGKNYLFKHASKNIMGTVETLRYQVDVNTLHRSDAPTLSLNEIGRCRIILNEPICYDDYRRNRMTGGLILVDRISNVTVGAAMILDRVTGDQRGDHWDLEPQSAQLHQEHSNVSAEERTARFGQRPVTVLLTGLTGAGKSTVAYALERKLFDQGRSVAVLDGQNMRLRMSRDLGFSDEDRSENLRRTAEVARLINDAGLICVAAFIAPSAEIRQRAAEAIGDERFLLIHLSAPVEICRQRAPEAYRLAEEGAIANFPGVSTVYEVPDQPDLTLPSGDLTVTDCVDRILQLFHDRGVIR
ncbi:MAG: bifunctional sulfate adenylyltransferase subunit 1/adenylylsulfate kinase [Planctomycetaceae bacterium]|nr:bifunctional sulfate adenylyltransferase subunit 1/adenylylsulfate kinase [Planctomycetaceae bacterium]